MSSFGHVYNGFLDELGGKVVAVKVFNLCCSGGSKSFIVECEAIRSIRHRNLVKVLTACSSVDYNGNDFKAIVYEFMDNSSLDKWLHPNIPAEEDLVEQHEDNVLLDNEMTGHLGDLKLARLLFHRPDCFLANQASSLGIQGTVGYAAPSVLFVFRFFMEYNSLGDG
ncbi:hypothetical protein LguiA_005011 [Lonicera macranthoides]